MEKTKSDIKQSMFVGKTEGSFREKYRVGKIIGQGAFGEVRICIHRESGGRRCLKVLKKKKLSDVE
jgi:calcium-dependent protein kinase